MATKAQQFKSEMQRTHREPEGKTPRRPPKPLPSNDAGARNLKARGHKATVTTEESLSGKPSRKSSRSSAHHGKNSSMLEYAARMRSQSPQKRHEKRSSP